MNASCALSEDNSKFTYDFKDLHPIEVLWSWTVIPCPVERLLIPAVRVTSG
jgi:hypothetical protein